MPGENPDIRFLHFGRRTKKLTLKVGAFDCAVIFSRLFKGPAFVAATQNIPIKPEIYDNCRFLPGFCNISKIISGIVCAALPKLALAQSTPLSLSAFGKLNSTSVIPIAIFGGTIGFSIFAAFWLIRERNKIASDNTKLRKHYGDLRATKERIDALVNVDDQRIIIWNPQDGTSIVLGNLGNESETPDDPASFTAFGRWLAPSAAMEFGAALDELRTEAKQFDLIVETAKGSFIETQGRVSGSFPFVRFRELHSERKNLASLSIEHNRLLEKFKLVETLFQNLPFPVWIRNEDYKLHWVNQAFANAVDAESIEAAANENCQLFDKNERDMISKTQAKQVRFEGSLPAIVAGDRRQLQTVDVKINSGSAGIAIDRSDVDAVKATLKETITSHAQTFDHLTTAVAIFDAKQLLSFANSSFYKLWDLTQEMLEDTPSNSDILEAMRNSGKLSEIPDWKNWKAEQLEIYRSTEPREEQWHLPDGQTLRVVANPQKQGGASWTFENVTEQLELKSNYNALMRVQGETLDHLSEAVAVFGSDGRIRLTNPTFLDLWRLGKEPGTGTVDGKHIKEIKEKCVSLLKTKNEWEKIEIGITDVDDERDDIEGRVEFLNGTILDYRLVRLPNAQTMLTLADMTAAVNIERALKERNEALEASDGLKTRFIQHVSYELRAPLTSIAGFAEILASDGTGKLNLKQAEYLNYISQSSDVLKALIDDILDLATIDAGVMQLELAPVSLNTAINESIEAVEDKLSRHQIKVNVDIEQGSGSIIADAARLRQIIYNLVSNAVNVSPDGTHIDITARTAGEFVELIICDEGPGIPDELKTRIFERFESGHAAERRKGAGLGLSIVKSFVELHGGNIHVENAGKRGARFICRLPLEPAAKLVAAE